jgi:deazaflavin-dependent oxidoreductase (nitroreductase family)
MSYGPSPKAHIVDQVRRYEESAGADGYLRHGYPCVIVTHRGRRSGLVRKTPLIRVVHERRYVLVGSLGGAARDPLWVHNLRADPAVTVRDGAEEFDVVVRELADPERAATWRSAVEQFPPYAAYQTRTERLIPLFRCDPVVDRADLHL